MNDWDNSYEAGHAEGIREAAAKALHLSQEIEKWANERIDQANRWAAFTNDEFLWFAKAMGNVSEWPDFIQALMDEMVKEAIRRNLDERLPSSDEAR